MVSSWGLLITEACFVLAFVIVAAVYFSERVKEKFMGKKKDQAISSDGGFEDAEPNASVADQSWIDETFKAAPKSSLVRLLQRVEFDVYKKDLPVLELREVAIRAEMIDIIEPIEVPTAWEFNPGGGGRSYTGYPFPYWAPTSTGPATKITLAGGIVYIIHGTTDEVLEKIDRVEHG